MSISVNCHFVTYSLHICMSMAIFKVTTCIIHSRDRPYRHISTFFPKIPYDNAAMPVNRIDAPGR